MAKAAYPPTGSRSPEAQAQREAYWRRQLQRWKKSGLAKSAFSRREGLAPSVLAWWDREIRRRDLGRRRANRREKPPPSPSFIPVKVIDPPMGAGAALEVVRGAHVVRVRPGFDPETLRRVLAVLEGRAC